ncbi:MAG: hypothetical protein WCJ26_05435 [bacterium]
MNKYFYITDNSGLIRSRSNSWPGSINLTVMSVRDMVTQVLENLGPGDRIAHMLITGAGNAGFQSLGPGSAHDHSGERSLQVGNDGRILSPADQYISGLNRKFVSGGFLTLGGEGVGRDPRLLQQMSMLLSGINVQAGVRNMIPLQPGDQVEVVRCSNISIFRGTAIW